MPAGKEEESGKGREEVDSLSKNLMLPTRVSYEFSARLTAFAINLSPSPVT